MSKFGKGLFIGTMVTNLVYAVLVFSSGCQSDCTPGEYECNDNRVMVCTSDDHWIVENDCGNAWPVELVCVEGDSDAGCEVRE